MKNGRFKINLFLGVLPKFRFILNLRLMAIFVVSGRSRESDRIRWILLNTGVFSAKLYYELNERYLWS